MAVTKLYLIRHGESEANAARIFIGHTDKDLTEKGHRQAENTAEFLKDLSVDVIYASDLLRAYHTAEHTAARHGLPVIPTEDLREIYAGDWEQVWVEDLFRLFPDSYGTWRNDIGLARCDGGESVASVQTRIGAAIARIAQKHPGQTVLLFTHATPIRAAAALWKGLPLERMKELPWASNASVTVAEYEDGVFRLLEYGIDGFQGELKGRV